MHRIEPLPPFICTSFLKFSIELEIFSKLVWNFEIIVYLKMEFLSLSNYNQEKNQVHHNFYFFQVWNKHLLVQINRVCDIIVLQSICLLPNYSTCTVDFRC